MEAAKAAVKDFMSKSGHHDTTVHEKVVPAVTHETVTRTQHENLQTAIDKEVHQDHYHTSVQPINDKNVLAEKHHHKTLPVEHRSFEHDNAKDVKAHLSAEQAKFRDESTRVEGEHSSTSRPIVGGEHVHHHVHETIQPVVHKQTIEPHVVHTTVPIHEVHHNAAQHHTATALPAVTMSEFKKHGGVLTGREERHDGFQGEPRTVGGILDGGKMKHSSTSQTGAVGMEQSLMTSDASKNGLGNTTEGSRITDANSRDLTSNPASMATGVGAHDATSSNTRSGSVNSSTHKATLLDKLNPRKDADGDGKAGIFD